MKNKLLLALSISAAFGLYACGDSGDSGNGPEEQESSSLPTCKSSKAGSVATEDGKKFVCAKNGSEYEWVLLSGMSSKSDGFKSCTEKKDGAYALAVDEAMLYQCIDGEWEEIVEFDNDSELPDNGGETGGASNEGGQDTPDEPSQEVSFVDGVSWQPSYGNVVNAGPYISKWRKFDDNMSGGSSLAGGSFKADGLLLTYELAYMGWYEVPYGTSYYMAPDPYPYAGFGFDFAADEGYANIQNVVQKGFCVSYAANKPVKVQITTESTDISARHFFYILPATSAAASVENEPQYYEDIALSKFKQASYTETENKVNLSTALRKARSVEFVYDNDVSDVSSGCKTVSGCEKAAKAGKSSSVKIGKVGDIGACGGKVEEDFDL